MNKLKLTWQDVFDCRKIFPEDFDSCKQIVRRAGYKYMSFNRAVYSIRASDINDIVCDEESLTSR